MARTRNDHGPVNRSKRVCPTCRGDGHHPMANHPRTDDTIAASPCPECGGSKWLPAQQGDKPKANSYMIGGDHYKKQKIQHWDYILANAIPYMEAQIIKYVSRWRDKGGIEDLKKARHFLDKLIEHEIDCTRSGGQETTEPQSSLEPQGEFCNCIVSTHWYMCDGKPTCEVCGKEMHDDVIDQQTPPAQSGYSLRPGE
jgi:ssDNA-binding Zn-finger/Zn-ribbon topoisomerase 1